MKFIEGVGGAWPKDQVVRYWWRSGRDPDLAIKCSGGDLCSLSHSSDRCYLLSIIIFYYIITLYIIHYVIIIIIIIISISVWATCKSDMYFVCDAYVDFKRL